MQFNADKPIITRKYIYEVDRCYRFLKRAAATHASLQAAVLSLVVVPRGYYYNRNAR